jgi:hypothetical protein
MKKILLALLLLAPCAEAHDIIVTWTRATTYSDGTPMPVTDIANHRIDVGTCAGANVFGTRLAVTYPAATATTRRISGFADGTYCVRMYTKTVAGQLSAPTGVASVTFSGGKVLPSAPSGVAVTGTWR